MLRHRTIINTIDHLMHAIIRYDKKPTIGNSSDDQNSLGIFKSVSKNSYEYWVIGLERGDKLKF